MKNVTLTLQYWKDGDWYVGQLVEVPGVMSQGETLVALQENIDDVYRLLLAERKQTFYRPRVKRRAFIRKLEADGCERTRSKSPPIGGLW